MDVQDQGRLSNSSVEIISSSSSEVVSTGSDGTSSVVEEAAAPEKGSVIGKAAKIGKSLAKKKKKKKKKEKEEKEKTKKKKKKSSKRRSKEGWVATTTSKSVKKSSSDRRLSAEGEGPSLAATATSSTASLAATSSSIRHPRTAKEPIMTIDDHDFMDNNHHDIGLKEVQIFEMLGEGSFCKVWKGKCRGKEVLLRTLKMQNLTAKDISELREEVKRLTYCCTVTCVGLADNSSLIFSKIRNPHIVLFMGACFEFGCVSFVTEYMPSNLELKLLRDRDRKDVTPYQRLKMAKDAALGVQWLHKMNTPMVHMNLHLSNLLVGTDGVVKIADFGFLNMRRKVAHRRDLASFVYMAPEFLRDGTKSEKCDVYSFACCLAEILTGEEVFKTLKREILLSNQPEVVLYDKIVVRGTRPKLHADLVPSPLADLIRCSWSPKPEERPNFDEIISLLDAAIIDEVINDSAGRALWSNNFVGRTRVPWEDFVTALCAMFMIPVPPLSDDKQLDVHWRCLKALLVGVDDSDSRLLQGGMVTLESFGSNLACFGPLMNLMGVAYLTRIKSVVELEYFHGFITPEMAEERLADQQPGTFLLRLSSHAGIFTVSVMTRKGVEHKRILYQPTTEVGPMYIHASAAYRTLPELLKAERAVFQYPFLSSRYKRLLAQDLDGSSNGVMRHRADYFIPGGARD